MRSRRWLVAAAAVLAVSTVAPAPSGAAAGGWRQKVSSRLLLDTAEGRTASFIVMLTSQADVGAAASLPTKDMKGRFVFDTLTAHADRTQAPIRALLDRRGAPYTSHWVVDLITVLRGDRALVQALAARPDVSRIDANDLVRSAVLPTTPPRLAPVGPATVEWNVSRVRAPAAWQQGFKGQGMVVGAIDTGFQWDHPALKPHYRGWNGSTADHNYSWYDEIDPSNRAPVDPDGHGTFIAGVMVGDDGGTNQIGVAPAAQWIGCRSMDQNGLGTPDTYIGCLEFMVAPFDLDGHNPDPSKAPVAVNNSWLCSIELGECPDQSVLLTAIRDVRAAGIVPVVAAGNSGPDCSTVGIEGPPAQYDESFTVGAVTFENNLATFSSRGPARFQGTRIKPDMVAPGEDVRSAWPTSTYSVESGTSTAAPHIVGSIALVYSAKPNLIGDVDSTERLLERTARRYNSSECSSNGTFPNNLFGYGLVNAGRATGS
jgi:serine protease AprX